MCGMRECVCADVRYVCACMWVGMFVRVRVFVEANDRTREKVSLSLPAKRKQERVWHFCFIWVLSVCMFIVDSDHEGYTSKIAIFSVRLSCPASLLLVFRFVSCYIHFVYPARTLCDICLSSFLLFLIFTLTARLVWIIVCYFSLIISSINR
jgi:hypothetical protein